MKKELGRVAVHLLFTYYEGEDTLITLENWDELHFKFLEARLKMQEKRPQFKPLTRKELMRLELKKALEIKEALEKTSEITPSDATDKILLNRYIELIEKQLKQPESKPQVIKSYQWNTKPDDELPELYIAMRDTYKLIDQSTTLEQFKAVFTGQPIDAITPIKWHEDNASELLYFNNAIEYLVDKVKSKYKRMESCFVKPDNEPFNAKWKSLNTNLSTNLSQEKQNTIKQMIKEF